MLSKLKDFTPDECNANKGSARGRKMIEGSLRSYGAGRSIIVDKNGRVIAGNKTLEMAEVAGIKDVILVQSDGTKLVAVQRTDLDLTTDKAAKELAVADNRTSEVSLDWDGDALTKMMGQVDLGRFFDKKELDQLLESKPSLTEKAADLPTKAYARVLISVPIDEVTRIKAALDEMAEVPGIQIDYSAN